MSHAPAGGVSVAATQAWDQILEMAGPVYAALLVGALWTDTDRPSLWDRHITDLLATMDAGAKRHRICAWCGKVRPRRGGSPMTCASPTCQRYYKKTKEIVRNRRRDAAADKRRYRENAHIRALSEAIEASGQSTPPLPPALRSARAAARAFVTPGKTAEQRALKLWLKGARRLDAVQAVKRARIYRERRSHTSPPK